MATIKKPKLKVYPKPIKGKKTLDKVKNWEAKNNEVIKDNEKLIKDYESKKSAVDKEKSAIASTIEKVKVRKSKVKFK